MSAPPRCVPLCGSKTLLYYEQALPLLGTSPLEGLARALSASPGWLPASRATLILRRSPTPLLAALGHFDQVGQTWLQGQIHSLHDACRRLRYISYAQVEADCRSLSELLRESLGSKELARAKFVAIPRGGFIILGLLASLLDLEPGQMDPLDHSERPVVVVDDCALTGARFRSFLQTLEHETILFAPLYSPPALREAILHQETRVSACLSAQDLSSFALDTMAVDGRPPAEFYWAGRTEALCFPWNEPDRTVWNPASRNWDLAWRIVPPELCLKNRPAPGQDLIPVQAQPEGTGPLRPSGRALFAEAGESISLFDLETSQGFSLTGTAADLWRALLRHGEIERSIAELAEIYEMTPEALRIDSIGFVEDLLARGLIEFSAPDSQNV
jgi:hypothetical protein